MARGLSDARRFQDLLDHPDPESPYDFAGMFATKSWGDRRRSRKRFKLLKRIDPQIRKMLEDGERVRYVTWGTAVSFWESYFLGWAIYYLNQRALVVTERRVLLIQIDSRMRPKELRDQLRYASIEKVKRTLLGNTSIRMQSGKTRLFSRVPGKDRTFLQQMLHDLRGMIGPDPTARDIEHLCPYCFHVVQGYPRACPSCTRPFKSPRRAGLLSLVFPGLGDFYLGHRRYGALEVLVAAIVWFGFVVPDPRYRRTPLGLAVGAVILFAILHGMDALATRYIGRKGIYPAG